MSSSRENEAPVFRPAELTISNSIKTEIDPSSTRSVSNIPELQSPIREELKSPGGSEFPPCLSHIELINMFDRLLSKFKSVTSTESKEIRKDNLSESIAELTNLIAELKKEGGGGGFCAALGIVLWCYFHKGQFDNFISHLKHLDSLEKDVLKSDLDIITILKLVVEIQKLPTDSPSDHFTKKIAQIIHENFSLGVAKKTIDTEIKKQCTRASFKDRLASMESGSLEIICNVIPDEKFKNCYHAVHVIRMSAEDFIFYDANHETIYKPVHFKLEDSDNIFDVNLINSLYDFFKIPLESRDSFAMEFNNFCRRPELDSVAEHISLFSDMTPRSQSAVVVSSSELRVSL